MDVNQAICHVMLEFISFRSYRPNIIGKKGRKFKSVRQKKKKHFPKDAHILIFRICGHAKIIIYDCIYRYIC